MKRMRVSRSSGAIMAAMVHLVVAPAAFSATFIWDGDLSGDWSDISGNPPSATTNWFPDLTVADPIPDSDDTVRFAVNSPHRTVDMGGHRTVRKVEFTSFSPYKLVPGGNFVLTISTGDVTSDALTTHEIEADVILGGTGDWSILSGELTMSGALKGGFALNKSGGGVLRFTGAGSYTGATTVQGGQLIISGADERLPDTALTIQSGALLEVDGITETVESMAGGGTAALLNGATLQVAPATARSFPGKLIGTAHTTFAVIGGNVQQLDGASSSFSGTARISGGVLRLGNASALTNATVAIDAPGGLDVTTAALDATIGALSGSADGTLDLGSQTLVTGANNRSTTYAGLISGSVDSVLRHEGSGTLTLTGGSEELPSAFGSIENVGAGGDIVVDGARIDLSRLGLPAALSIESGDVILRNGADVRFPGAEAMVRGNGTTLTVTGAGTTLSGLNLYALTNEGTPATIIVEENATLSIGNLAPGIGDNGIVTIRSGATVTSGRLILGIEGSGVIEVSGSGTEVDTEFVALGGQADASRGGTGLISVTDGADITASSSTKFWSSTSVLEVDGGTFRTNWLDEFPGVTATMRLSDPAGGSALSLGAANGVSTFSGLIEDADTGPGSIRKVATNTLLLSGDNTFSGGLVVESGFLQVENATGSATGTGPVELRAGAELTGSGAVGGTAVVAAGASVAPGTGIGILTLASLELAGSYRCELGEGDADRLIVTGSLVLGGTVDFDVTGTLTADVYIVATYGSASGAFQTVVDLPDGYKLDLAYDDGSSSNHIALVALTPYESWAIGNGLELGTDAGFFDDPNGDDRPNIEHFALDTDPLGAGTDEGKTRGALIEDGDDGYFSLTLPVRAGAVFAGSPSPEATIDGVRYTIAGTDDLAEWELSLVEVSPVAAADLPALSAGWEYRTFRFASVFGVSARGFIRCAIAPVE